MTKRPRARAGNRVEDIPVRREAQRIFDRIVMAKTFLEGVDLALIEDLLHRQRVAPSREGLRGRAYDGTGTKSSGDDTVVRAVLAERPLPSDPVGCAIESLLHDIEESCAGLRGGEKKLIVIFRAADKFRGRPSKESSCNLCNQLITGVGNDRSRRGLCQRCFMEWYRLPIPRPSVPDWVRREKVRREAEAAEQRESGELQVGPRDATAFGAPSVSVNGVTQGLYDDEMGEIDRLRARGELPPERVKA